MNFTKSLDYIIHALTGQRRHEDAQALPTVVSDIDIDAPTWEIMEVIKAAGIAPLDFDYDNPTSYTQLYAALIKHTGASPITTYTAPAAGLAAVVTKAQCGIVVVDAALGAANITLDVSNITAAAGNDKQTYRWVFKRADAASDKMVNIILPANKRLIKTGQMTAASASTIIVPLTGVLDIVYDPQTNTIVEIETTPIPTATTAGTATAYTATTVPATGALVAGQTRAQLTVHLGNNGAPSTVNINGQGAKPFKQRDSTGALVDTVTYTGQVMDVIFDGTNAVALGTAPYQASDAGKISYYARQTAPPGELKANGACVLVASYAALTAAIYCGDAINATAEFGYRCTDATGVTRSPTGAYIRLPDMRGEFPRGWDDARGVDAGRAFGSWQNSQNLSHSHSGVTSTAGNHNHVAWTDTQGNHAHNVNSYRAVNNSGTTNGSAGAELSTLGGGGGATTDAQGNHAHNVGIGDAGSHTHTIPLEGGAEARPRNVALLACIKY